MFLAKLCCFSARYGGLVSRLFNGRVGVGGGVSSGVG